MFSNAENVSIRWRHHVITSLHTKLANLSQHKWYPICKVFCHRLRSSEDIRRMWLALDMCSMLEMDYRVAAGIPLTLVLHDNINQINTGTECTVNRDIRAMTAYFAATNTMGTNWPFTSWICFRKQTHTHTRTHTHHTHIYRQTSNINRTKFPNLNVARLVLQLPMPSQVSIREWRCSLRSSNYIWVINNCITY